MKLPWSKVGAPDPILDASNAALMQVDLAHRVGEQLLDLQDRVAMRATATNQAAAEVAKAKSEAMAVVNGDPVLRAKIDALAAAATANNAPLADLAAALEQVSATAKN